VEGCRLNGRLRKNWQTADEIFNLITSQTGRVVYNTAYVIIGRRSLINAAQWVKTI